MAGIIFAKVKIKMPGASVIVSAQHLLKMCLFFERWEKPVDGSHFSESSLPPGAADGALGAISSFEFCLCNLTTF